MRRRIASGTWKTGERLPSCRAIANELGSNPNTVSRQLQRLAEEGLVRIEQRRGTFVTGRRSAGVVGPDPLVDLRAAAAQAASLGISGPELHAAVDEVLQGISGPRIALTECNPVDLERMEGLIRNATGVSVVPVLLDDLRERHARQPFDLIASPLFHLGETIERVGGPDNVVDLNFIASQESIRRLASLLPDRQVIVLTPSPGGAERIGGLVRGLFPGTVQVLVADGSRDAQLPDAIDVLVRVNAVPMSAIGGRSVRDLITIDWVLEGSSADRFRSAVETIVGKTNATERA